MASIEFGTWETPETVNPYLETVEAMIKNGPETAVTVKVGKDEALKTRTAFAKAANAHDKTARVRVNGEPILDEKGKDTGNVKFVFTLTAKHKARRGSK